MIILLSCLVFILFVISFKLLILIDDQGKVVERLVLRLDNHIRYEGINDSFKIGGSE